MTFFLLIGGEHFYTVTPTGPRGVCGVTKARWYMPKVVLFTIMQKIIQINVNLKVACLLSVVRQGGAGTRQGKKNKHRILLLS